MELVASVVGAGLGIGIGIGIRREHRTDRPPIAGPPSCSYSLDRPS